MIKAFGMSTFVRNAHSSRTSSGIHTLVHDTYESGTHFYRRRLHSFNAMNPYTAPPPPPFGTHTHTRIFIGIFFPAALSTSFMYICQSESTTCESRMLARYGKRIFHQFIEDRLTDIVFVVTIIKIGVAGERQQRKKKNRMNERTRVCQTEGN